jgi:hypothetical protein
MAVSDPTNTYKWLLPDVGGDIGAWGGLLNTIFSNELGDIELENHIGTGSMIAPENGAVPPPGIDQVVHLLSVELEDSKDDLLLIADRVTTLEGAPPVLLTGRTGQAAGQSIAGDNNVPLRFDTVAFDQGGLFTPDPSVITIPTDGLGLWQFRASIKVQLYGAGSGSDDGRFLELSIVKPGSAQGIMGFSRLALLENGVHSGDSGDISLEVSAIDVAADMDTYEVWLKQGIESQRSKGVRLSPGEGLFFEGIRITREIP